MRLSVKVVSARADSVSHRLGLAGETLCAHCAEFPTTAEQYYPGCKVILWAENSGYAIRLRHADTSHSSWQYGFGTLREVNAFLQGMDLSISYIRAGGLRERLHHENDHDTH